MHDYTLEQMADWFAGLPAWLTFAGAKGRVGLTADRTPDDDGKVALQFPDGVRRVALTEVRFWPQSQDYPGGRKRRG